jgi:cell division septal protein FtsQ
MESERMERFVKLKVVLTEHKIKFSRYDFRPNDGPKEKKKPKRVRMTEEK